MPVGDSPWPVRALTIAFATLTVWLAVVTADHAVGIPLSGTGDVLALVGLAVAMVAAGMLQVEFRRGEHSEAVDLFEAVLMPALLLYAGPVAMVLAGGAKVASQLLLRIRGDKLAFNVAQWTAAVGVGSLVFTTTWTGERGVPEAIGPLVLATIAVMVVNHVAVVAVLSVVQRQSVPSVVRDLQPVIQATWLVGGTANLALGVLFAALAAWSPPLVLLAVVPLVLFDSAHRATTTARIDRRRLGLLHQATALLAQAAEPVAALPQVMAKVGECFQADAVHHIRLADGDDASPLQRMGVAVAATGCQGRVTVADQGWERLLRDLGVHAALVAPVADADRTVGALVVVEPGAVEGTAEGEAAVLSAFALEIGAATARGEAVAAAIAERRLLRKVLDANPDGVFAITEDARVAIWNPAMARLTGYGADEITTVEDMTVLEATDSHGIALALGGGQPTDQLALPDEVRIRDRLGQPVWLGCSYEVAPASVGQPKLHVITVRDITEERELAQLKDEFVSIASHELRTPATVIQGMAQSLMIFGHRMTDEERADAAKGVYRGALRLSRVVTNVLAATKVEDPAGFGEDTFEVAPICGEAITEVVIENGVEPELVHVDDRLGGQMAVGRDSAALQILVNLIGNAAKYGAGKPIQITMRRDEEAVVVEVRDFGPGIPLHEQDRVFERFERLHQHDAQAGNGLGLYISRRLAEMCGGTLTLRSAPGAGATFVLRLPAADTTIPLDDELSSTA